MKEKKRDYSGDFLRILLIVIIIVHHSLVHGIGLSQLKSEIVSTQFSALFFLLNSFGVMAVNAFFFVSGFYGIRRDFKKLINLYMICVIYAFIWNVIVVMNGGGISFQNIKAVIFPIRDYWFMAVYLVIALLAPYIKIMFDNIDNKQRCFIVFIVTVVNIVYGFVFNFVGVGDGYTLFQGVNLYFIGLVCAYNSKDLFKYRKSFGIVGIGCVALEFALTYFAYLKGMYFRAWHLFAYNNPVVIMMSVAFCVLFLNLGWKKGKITIIITKISSYSLAAYLLTDNMYAKKIVFSPLNKLLELHQSSIAAFFEIMGYATILTFICVMIDMFREKITEFIYVRIKR